MATFDPFGAGDGDGNGHGVRQTLHPLPHPAWVPTLQTACDFPPEIFQTVALNLIQNPNIGSKLLFRADILYDSLRDGSPSQACSSDAEDRRAALQQYGLRDGDLPAFEIKHTLIRMMIPRNPQLDKPIAQTCQLLQSIRSSGAERVENLVVYTPHTSCVEDLPWYHPRAQAVAYLHSWRRPSPSAAANAEAGAARSPPTGQGAISVHYRLFPSQSLPLSERLVRTASHLLSIIHRHGQGALAGYTKRVHHDQLISQQRVQDTYTELKYRHADRLRNNWVEQTEPSKHVFEDLGIAAFLIELWKDMYPGHPDIGHDGRARSFPGFVDIGCGNGVLVDVLIREGYPGWGLDARRRKTWATFEPSVQDHLKELILIPQPLFERQAASHDANADLLAQISSFPCRSVRDGTKAPIWHNGVFPLGTFIISNHADELTPWTPLLASISASPFLAIPCCSHNLSGLRFRAPSAFNSYSADRLAPSYFAANVSRSKSVAIRIACSEIDEEAQPARGDLKDLAASARGKQPSAYSSLCDWVAHLAAEVGYVVEKEVLRLPSTRNMGIVCRRRVPGFDDDHDHDDDGEASGGWGTGGEQQRMERVKVIMRQEGADGTTWVERAMGLVNSKGNLNIH
jgi:tRNASer (uridine44-2'-O)-methyltransferase